jgi:anti-sigma B factor antagonist
VDYLEVEEADDRIVVRLNTTLSLREDNIPSITAELFRVADRLGRRTLSLDLGRVGFLTANALGQLINLHKKVRAGSGRLRLCNVSPPAYLVFEITRLHEFMDITPSKQPREAAPQRTRVKQEPQQEEKA